MSQPTVGSSTTVVRFSELDSLMPGRLPTHKHRHQPALSETKHRSGANPHLGELPHRLGRERQKGGFTGLPTCLCLIPWHCAGVATKSPRRTMRTSHRRVNARRRMFWCFNDPRHHVAVEPKAPLRISFSAALAAASVHGALHQRRNLAENPEIRSTE